jgi:hypothetical protein
MALVVKDRVKEYTFTSGTANLELDGAYDGFQSFAVIGDGNTTYYAIVADNNIDWEVGIGTYQAGVPGLTRDTVLSNSLGTTAKVSFPVGDKAVFCTYPADRSVTIDDPATLTNKRINPRTSTTAATATLTPNIASFDQYDLTAQDQALTVAAPTGTPVNGNKLVFRILDNGTARAITWNATYTVIGTTLPTSTVPNKTVYVGCIYNSTNARWDVVAVATQA